jgi:uncharacterized membrane protein YeaQ/YmgE (transglycosylase-associated protein family)
MFWIAMLGCVAGVLARLVAPGRRGPFGFLLTTSLGIMGAFAAAYLGQEAGWYSLDDPGGLVSAVAGAVIVLSIWGYLFRSPRPSSSM